MHAESKGEILLYKTPEGETEIDVKLEKETIWLTLNQMGFLFNKDKSVISRHILNIFSEKELNRISTVAKFATVQTEGNKRIADNALVALCLLIAESNPKEKEMIVKVIVNLINKMN